MKALKKVFLLIFVLIFSVVSGIFIFNGDFTFTSSKSVTKPIVILDAGHGGFDGGAVAGDGTVEKDINLNLTLNVSEMLAFSGYDVILTRNSDTGTEEDPTATISKRKVSDLKNRLSLINKYENAIFVSLHLNKFTTSTANGAQVFYSKNNEKSSALGQTIQNSIVEKLQPDNQRVIKQGTKSTYLLYNAKIPAVIVECGFLSNKAELKKLKDEKYQREMSYAIFCGILNYINKEC